MSQYQSLGGGSGSAIETINGDVGSVTGSTVTFTGGTSGAVFTGVGTTMTESFNFLSLPATTTTHGQILINGFPFLHGYDVGGDGNNVYLGQDAGNFTNTGDALIGIGKGALANVSGDNNTIGIGFAALNQVNGGFGSVVIGTGSCESLINGSFVTSVGDGCATFAPTLDDCVFLGGTAGNAYGGGEHDNILIGSQNLGVIAETNVLRIGNATGTGRGNLQKSIIHGIVGVTVANPSLVTINTSTGQLGNTPFLSGVTFVPTIVGSVTPGVTTYTVQTGIYTVIGNIVFFECFIGWSASTASGNLSVAGFPVTIGASETAAIPISFILPAAGINQIVYASANIGTNNMTMTTQNSVTGTVTLVQASATGTINFKSFYVSN